MLGARKWMIERYPFIDSARVGLVGWSHGGMIALFNIFFHPDAYACAYAGGARERSARNGVNT